jgi:hypothetical protein
MIYYYGTFEKSLLFSPCIYNIILHGTIYPLIKKHCNTV